MLRSSTNRGTIFNFVFPFRMLRGLRVLRTLPLKVRRFVAFTCAKYNYRSAMVVRSS